MRERDCFLDPDGNVVAEALTNVPLPAKIDICDASSVVALLERLVYDEVALNPEFLGVVVGGSFARGCANSGSDLDLCYAVRNPEVSCLSEIKRRIRFIFGLYGIMVEDTRIWPLDLDWFKEPDIVLEEIEEGPEPDQLRRGYPIIDRDSKFLIKDTLAKQVIIDFFNVALIEPKIPVKNHKPERSAGGSVKILDPEFLENAISPRVRRY